MPSLADESPAQRLGPFEQRELEAQFQAWYRSWAERAGIDYDPDNPEHRYDYGAAFLAGVEPKIDPSDKKYHWPSKFKMPDHPNRFVNGIDTITGQPTQKQEPGRFGEWLRR